MLPIGLDVADSASVQAAAAALAEDPGRLDILINNAAAYVDWTNWPRRLTWTLLVR